MIRFIEAKDLKELIKDNKTLLIDVREIDEYRNDGKLNDSILFPLSEIISKKIKLSNILEKNTKNKEIVFYCRAGKRSHEACKIFEKENINNIILNTLIGGLLFYDKDKEDFDFNNISSCKF